MTYLQGKKLGKIHGGVLDYTKRKLILKADDHYIHKKDWHKDISFDIVGVYQDKNGNMNFKQFEDAFY